MLGVRFLLSLERSAARTGRFLMCIGTDLSVSKSFPKDDALSLHTIHRQLFLKMVDFSIPFMAVKHPY